jgi:hypothetical protein
VYGICHTYISFSNILVLPACNLKEEEAMDVGGTGNALAFQDTT